MVGSWIGRQAWTRKASKRPESKDTQGAKSSEAPLPPSGESACARAATGRDHVVPVTFQSAKKRHAVLTEQADKKTRMCVPARPLRRQLELFRLSCQEPTSQERARGRGREGKGPTAHFHWWSLFVDPALPPYFRERAEEVGWWRWGQDGGAFEDSKRLGSSPQVKPVPEPGQRRRVADVAFSLRRVMPDPGYP